MKMYRHIATLFAVFACSSALAAEGPRLSITASTNGVVLWPTNGFSIPQLRGDVTNQWRTDITNIIGYLGLSGSNGFDTNVLNSLLSSYYPKSNPSNFSTLPQLNTSSNANKSYTDSGTNAVAVTALANQVTLSNSVNTKITTTSNALQASITAAQGASTNFVTNVVASATNNLVRVTETRGVTLSGTNAIGSASATTLSVSGAATFNGNISVNSDFSVSGNFTSGSVSSDGTIQTTDIFSGNGSGLTNLNASRLASGTVPTARMGSGAANSGTFLRGDNTWAIPSGGGGGGATNLSPWTGDINGNTYSLTNAARLTAGEVVSLLFTGNGSGLTNITTSSTNATQISGAALTTVSNIVEANTLPATDVLGAPGTVGTSFNGGDLTNVTTTFFQSGITWTNGTLSSPTNTGTVRGNATYNPPFYVGTEGTGLAALRFNDYQLGPGMYSIAGSDTWVLPVSTATDLLFGYPSVGYGLRVAPGRDVYVGRNLHITDRGYGDGTMFTVPLENRIVGRRKPPTETGEWRKPCIAYTPWWETFITNNAAWSSNKLTELSTNGFVAAVQAAGTRPIWWWDDSLTATNRIGGSLVINSNRYPFIQQTVGHARAKGFDIGVYTAFATNTCGGSAGTPRWAVQLDCNWFASVFGMDALKVDNCGDAGFGTVDTDSAYELNLANLFNSAIQDLPYQSGFGGTNSRPVFLLASSVWASSGTPLFQTRIANQVNSWQDPISSIVPPVEGTSNVVRYLARATNVIQFTGYGHYTDLFGFDVPNMNTNTIQAAMTACAILPSPIIVGGITDANRQWFTNSELYAIHQDDLTIPGTIVSNNPAGLSVWKRQLANGEWAIAVFNTGASNTFSLNLNYMSLSNRYAVRDVWQQASAGYAYQTLSVSANTNSGTLYKLTPITTDPVFIAGSDGASTSFKRADGSTMAAIGTLPGFNNFGALWLTPPSGSPSVNNYVANSSGASLTLNAPDAAGSVLFYGANSTLFGFINRNGLMLKSNPTTPPAPGVGEVYLWNSNNVIWGVSNTKTNLISNLQ